MRVLVFFSLIFLINGTISVFAQTIQQSPEEKLSLRQIAVLTMESSLVETSKIEDFTERIELTEKIVQLLQSDNFDLCQKSVERLFNDLIDAKKQTKEETQLNFDDAVGKVIRIASLLNDKTAQKYIERYKKIIEEEEQVSKEKSDYVQAKIYLKIAIKLLETNPDLAFKTAEKSLISGVLFETLEFLVKLKKKQAGLADNFFFSALQTVESDGAKDINELFILYSYVFAKPQVPFVTENTLAYFPNVSFAGDFSSSPNINLAPRFLQSSVNLLSMPARLVADKATKSIHGALGDYYFLKITEQFIVQYAPQLKNRAYQQQVAIFNYLEQEKRDNIAGTIDKWNSPKTGQSVSSKEKWLEKAAKAQTPELKDSYLYEAAVAAISAKEYEDALKIAGEFSGNVEQTFLPFVRYSVARKLLENQEFNRIEEILAKDSDDGRKVSLYVFMAKETIKEKNFLKAKEFLLQAEKLKGKLENSEKALSEFAIASLYSIFDETAAVSLWQDGLRNSNKIEGFTNKINAFRNFEKDGFEIYYRLFDEQMKPVNFLPKLAKTRFPMILNEVSTINQRVFRIESQIAVCSSLMKEKPTKIQAKAN